MYPMQFKGFLSMIDMHFVDAKGILTAGGGNYGMNSYRN